LHYRFAFGDPDAQEVGENAFDGDGLDLGDEFEVTADAWQVDEEEVLALADAGPTADLVGSDPDAISLDFYGLEGEESAIEELALGPAPTGQTEVDGAQGEDGEAESVANEAPAGAPARLAPERETGPGRPFDSSVPGWGAEQHEVMR